MTVVAVLNSGVHTAAKEHTCNACEGTINIGELYSFSAWIDSHSKFHIQKLHYDYPTRKCLEAKVYAV